MGKLDIENKLAKFLVIAIYATLVLIAFSSCGSSRKVKKEKETVSVLQENDVQESTVKITNNTKEVNTNIVKGENVTTKKSNGKLTIEPVDASKPASANINGVNYDLDNAKATFEDSEEQTQTQTQTSDKSTQNQTNNTNETNETNDQTKTEIETEKESLDKDVQSLGILGLIIKWWWLWLLLIGVLYLLYLWYFKGLNPFTYLGKLFKLFVK